MFVYSLSGLALSDDRADDPVEIEENETTARSAVYQLLGRLFTPPDVDHWERARDGRWGKELAEAAAGLPYALVVGDLALADDVDRAAFEAAFAAAFDGAVLGGDRAPDRARALEEINRAYEYFGLAAASGGDLPADHLVSECDYLQYLTFREAAAQSDRLRKSYRRAQLEFLDGHLAWTASLPDCAPAAGTLLFLAEAALLVASFVHTDTEYVRSLVG